MLGREVVFWVYGLNIVCKKIINSVRDGNSDVENGNMFFLRFGRIDFWDDEGEGGEEISFGCIEEDLVGDCFVVVVYEFSFEGDGILVDDGNCEDVFRILFFDGDDLGGFKDDVCDIEIYRDIVEVGFIYVCIFFEIENVSIVWFLDSWFKLVFRSYGNGV